MKNNLVLLILTVVIFSLSACSGGGRRSTGGRQCSLNSPISMTPAPEQKVVELENAKTALPAGYYEYLRTDIYYVHNNDFRMHVKDYLGEDNQIHSGVECVRNAVLGFKGISISSTGVTRMDIDNIKPILVDTKQFSFDTLAGKIHLNFLPLEQSKAEAPSEVYKAAFTEPIRSFIIQHSEEIFELRSHGRTAEGEMYYSVQYRRKNR